MSDPALVLRDILRVDHAGEYGAIRIYRAQIAIAHWRAPDLIAMLQDALADETRHRDRFDAGLQERGLRPCDMLPLWGVGGTLLGTGTALLGREAILVCTEAVERTVHRHMDDQVAWLMPRAPDLATAIAAIRDEEVDHLHRAQRGRAAATSPAWLRLVDVVVATATELLVWLSTYGASSRLHRHLGMKDGAA
jgi:ubiquinone biosynthesis monooxygenase Coq7